MSKHPVRYKLLLDEGFFSRKRLPRLNSRHDVKHIKFDLHKEHIHDIEVYKTAELQGRIVVVFNIKDFRKYSGISTQTGVIGVSQKMSDEDIDKKITALLSKCRHADLYGKYNSITLNSKVR